jgi:hypothetical protein
LKEKFTENPEYMLNYSFPYSCSYILSRLLEWRSGLSDTILKGGHIRIIPVKFGSKVSEEKI